MILVAASLLLFAIVVLVVGRWPVVVRRATSTSPVWLGMRGAWAVIVLFLLLAWGTAVRSSLWDRDEPRFARAAVEMVDSGDYLVPTFNGKLRPDKPALIYWLMSVTLRLFGQGEWAVRCWSALGVAAAALFAATAARRYLGADTPALAAVVLLTSPLVFGIAGAATADGVLLGCVTGAVVVFAFSLDRPRWYHLPFLGLLLGLAQLVKGPVGLAIPVLAGLTTLAILRWREGKPLRPGLVRLGLASFIGTGLFLAWALPANTASGGELARRGLGHHVVARMQEPLESHGGDFFVYLLFYPLVLLLLMAPWTLFLPATIAAVIRRAIGDLRGRAVLIGWAVPVVILMTLVATKLPHYVLPAFPAFAVALASVVIGAERRQLDDVTTRWLRRGRWFFAPVGLLFASAFFVAPRELPIPAAEPHLIGLGVLWLLITMGGLWLHARRAYLATALVLAIGAVLFYLQLGGVMAAVETAKPSPKIAQAVRTHTAPRVPVAASGFQEPSLAFYMDRVFTEIDTEQVVSWAAVPGDRAVILTAEELDELPDLAGYGFREVERVPGFNFAKGAWVEVVLFVRD